MQFDAKELRPTYHFQIGLPGSSFALEMARRMGFAPHILENAKRFLGDSKHALEELITKMNFELQRTYQERKKLRNEREAAERLAKQYQQKLRDLENEKRDLRRQSLQESKRLLAQSSELIEKVIKEIKDSAGDSEKIKSARREVEKMRRDLAAEETKIGSEKPKETESFEIAVGDKSNCLIHTPQATCLTSRATMLWSLSATSV